MENRTSKQNQLEDYQSDRSLNDFPEEVLIHILKFLPIVDAVRTCILSRQWPKLWRLLPSLDFDLTNFPQHSSASCTRIIEFIDQTLKNRSDISIHKFCISFDWFFGCECNEHDVCDIIESKFDEWISYAISHNTIELDIENPSDDDPYDFDLDLLSNSHVHNVRFCGGVLSSGLPSLNLNSVRSVCLVEISLTDDRIVDLILWCNKLESLTLDNCYGMDNVRICSATLENLSLKKSEGSSLNICCPNLSSLLIFNFNMNKYCVKASASLEADIRFCSGVIEWSNVLRELTGVKRLTTNKSWSELLCKKEDAFLNGCVFENLNHLELYTGSWHDDLLGIAALLKICPNITTLTLNFDECNNENELVDKPIEFNIPNLKILNLEYTTKGR